METSNICCSVCNKKDCTSFNMFLFPLKNVIEKVMLHILIVFPHVGQNISSSLLIFYSNLNVFVSQTPTFIFSLTLC